MELLKQKTHVDSSTNQPTEVKIPILGRLNTNYPSLVFVFLGFFAAMYAFKEFRVKEKVQWTIKSKFEDKYNRIRNWKEGELNIRPSNFQARVTVDTSVLNKKTDYCRFYKPIPLDYYY
jgi:hypothetical protein